MFIVPVALEQQISRVDRQQSRRIGIASGVFAAWCAFRLIWLTYVAVAFGAFSAFSGSLIFSFVLWGVLGTAAAIAAVGFLAHAKGSGDESN